MSTEVIQGGTGIPSVDYSANVETLPPATWVLIKSIPKASHSARSFVEIQNRSTSPLRFIVYDTRTDTIGTVYTLAAATAQYLAGGSWSSAYDKGRIDIYGAAGTETFSARTS